MRVRLGIVAFRARTAWDTPTKARALIRPMWPAVRRTTPDSHHRTRRHRGPTHATISPKVSFRSGVDEVFSKPIVAGQRALSSFHTLSPGQPICGSRLNARGTPLTAADLIKNFVFQRLVDASMQEDIYHRYWTEFETPFWETEVQSGRVL